MRGKRKGTGKRKRNKTTRIRRGREEQGEREIELSLLSGNTAALGPKIKHDSNV